MNDSILLTTEERRRFAEWLEREATTDLGLINQMKKIKVPVMLIVDRQMDVDAALRVAHKLRSTSSESI